MNGIEGDKECEIYTHAFYPSAASLFLYHYYSTMSTDPPQPSHGKLKRQCMKVQGIHFYLSDPPPPQPPLSEHTLTESPPCQQTTSTNPTPNEPDDHTSHENTHENTPHSETTIPSNHNNTHTGPAQEYLVKTIRWVDFNTREAKDVRIITQNGNKGLANLDDYICLCQDTEM